MRRFVRERRFARYHRPKNLAMSAAIEAAELMELFQWHDVPARRLRSDGRLRRRASEEISDTLAYLLSLCDAAGIDLTSAFRRKMRLNERRYPVHGRSLPRRR
ncbi:MAG: hypothetical protein MOGMAGMI_01264 [Candidatus Omnitrophica bacterium]|nr:hypothetical protein [Candidatus Omnitrophota bacterium]